MSQNSPASLDRRAAEWLDDGPSAAPPSLLAATFQRSRRTPQRSGWLALALGAPAVTDGRASWPIALRPLLVVLGVLLAAGVMLAVSGTWKDRTLTVFASPSQPPSPTSQASPEPFTATPTINAPPALLAIDGWGITLDRQPTLPWQAVKVGFDGDSVGTDPIGDHNRYIATTGVDQASRDLFFGPCDPDGCAGPLITVSVARNDAGLVVDTTSCEHAPPNVVFDCLASNLLWPVTVTGDTLDELRKSWLASVGEATATQVTLGNEPAVMLARNGRSTVLAIHGDIRVAIITQPLVYGGEEDAARAFASVVASFRFDDLPSPSPTSSPQARAGTVGDLRLTMPDGWTVRSSRTSVSVTQAGAGLFRISQQVTLLHPGESLKVGRPVASGHDMGQGAGFTISGGTFEALVAAIDAGMPDATRASATIDGVSAYRWGVPQTSYVGPLAFVAAVEWKGSFYVFVEHLPLDGSAGDSFDMLLGGVSLE